MLLKQKSITSQKLGSQDFWGIANRVLNKGQSAMVGLELLFSAFDKAKLLKTFLRTLILVTQVSLYLFPF